MRPHLKALIVVVPLLVSGVAAAQSDRRPPEQSSEDRRDREHEHRRPGRPPAYGEVVAVRPGIVAGPVAAIAPPPVVVVPGNPNFFAPPGSFITRVPVVIFPDGRVFAELGHGFEQIVRGCPGGMAIISSVLPGPVQPRAVQPTVIQPPAVVTQPLPYNPPLPGQQLMAQPLDYTTATQILAGQTMIVNQSACWAVNGYGQVFVYRP